MRSDMAKVIVERPRIHPRWESGEKGYARRLHRFPADEQPRREGMKARVNGGGKVLNEHLGPLRRYLLSQVGRPWDKIFSEICAHINRNSAVQDHVRDHVWDFVARHVVLIDGMPCSGEPGSWYGEPLHKGWRRYETYICPLTGLLKRVQKPARRPTGRRRKQYPKYIRLDATRQCRFLDGAWHLVTLRPMPQVTRPCPGWDVVLNRPVSDMLPSLAIRTYGAPFYAAERRRLSKKEMRNLPIPIDLQ